MNDRIKDDGGPAFPPSVAEIQGRATNSCEFGLPGMSLRDYFAGEALKGYLSSFGADSPHPACVVNGDRERRDQRVQSCADMSYALADAMLEARKR